jgi:hypothetical protein
VQDNGKKSIIDDDDDDKGGLSSYNDPLSLPLELTALELLLSNQTILACFCLFLGGIENKKRYASTLIACTSYANE